MDNLDANDKYLHSNDTVTVIVYNKPVIRDPNTKHQAIINDTEYILIDQIYRILTETESYIFICCKLK